MITPAALILTDAAGRARVTIPAMPGGSVELVAWEFSPRVPTVGVSYRLAADGRVFTLSGRDVSASPFNDTFTNAPTLDSLDLGAVAGDLVAVGRGIFQVARYQLTVAPDAPPGLYTIDPAALGGAGLVDPITFADLPWTDLEGVQVRVGAGAGESPVPAPTIPEPASIMAVGSLGLAALMLKRVRPPC